MQEVRVLPNDRHAPNGTLLDFLGSQPAALLCVELEAGEAVHVHGGAGVAHAHRGQHTHTTRRTRRQLALATHVRLILRAQVAQLLTRRHHVVERCAQRLHRGWLLRACRVVQQLPPPLPRAEACRLLCSQQVLLRRAADGQHVGGRQPNPRCGCGRRRGRGRRGSDRAVLVHERRLPHILLLLRLPPRRRELRKLVARALRRFRSGCLGSVLRNGLWLGCRTPTRHPRLGSLLRLSSDDSCCLRSERGVRGCLQLGWRRRIGC